MKENDRIYYYGTSERGNHLLRYWRRKKTAKWYLMILAAQLIYGAFVWNADNSIIVQLISGLLVPGMITLILSLEYRTIKLINKGYDLLHDHVFMNDFVKYIGIEYTALTAPIDSHSHIHVIYISRYLLLLLTDYSCVTMVYERYGIRFRVDPYRKEYSYGRTRLDRYVTTKDIFS